MSLQKFLPLAGGAPLVRVAVLFCGLARADTITVYKTGDNGAGTLRQAIHDAASGDTINFSITGTISLTSGELLIDRNLTINGPGARRLTVQRSTAGGTPDFRIFYINSGTVSLAGLSIVNGSAGGGLYNNGTATIHDCTISGNNAGTLFGGGILNDGLLTLNRCTISGNIAEQGAGIDNQGTLTLNNCTVADNAASTTATDHGGGGGIANIGPATNLTVHGCTISGNSSTTNLTSSGGGGILNQSGRVDINDTIVSGNSSDQAGKDVKGAFVSGGYNLIRIADGGTGFNATGDQTGTTGSPINANLGPLQNNGGPTNTRLPQGSSPAKDQGKSFALATDQRDRPRTYDNPATPNAVGGDGSDIGAVEVHPARTLIVTFCCDSGFGSLRQAIEDAAPVDSIVFAPGLSGIGLGSGTLLIDKDLTITGPGDAILSVARFANPGTPDFALFTMQPAPGSSITVNLSGLAITDGRSPSGGGVINYPDSTLTVTDCTFLRNESIQGLSLVGNGGAMSNGGTAILNHCSFLRNESAVNGGGLFNRGTATLNQCFFFGNFAFSGGGGGAYSFGGTLTMDGCTFSTNSAESGAGLLSSNPGTITGCTFLQNFAGSSGGGLLVIGSNTISNCTFSSNYAPDGAGLYVSENALVAMNGCTIAGNTGNTDTATATDGGGGIATVAGGIPSLRIRNSIIAGNTHPWGGPDISGEFISDGYNLIGIKSGGTGFTDGTNHDQVGTLAAPINPMLGPLQDNGGPAWTRALLPGSPAIDAGRTSLTTDQRGWARRYDDPASLNASGTDLADIGAFELQPGAPGFVALVRNGNVVSLTLKGEPNLFYQLQSSETLLAFTNFGAPAKASAAGILSFIDNGPLVLKRFYRVFRVP